MFGGEWRRVVVSGREEVEEEERGDDHSVEAHVSLKCSLLDR
jgi:hypothetical protein